MLQHQAKHAAGLPGAGTGTRVDGFVSSVERRTLDTPCGIHCDHCGLEFEEGYRPDPCLGGYLPDVSHACCGHGETWRAYVAGAPDALPDQSATLLRDGRFDYRGSSALVYFATLGVGPLCLPPS